MILVDTSVWVDHFHHSDETLKELLLSNQVCIHPFILGELSCGNFRNRKEVLSLLRTLRSIDQVLDEEVFILIEDRKLFGRGLGFIDIHLLASALIHHVPIWTRDKSLRLVAGQLGISY
ncbi:MAG TPA: type II toxin-antitoxin system VapC family toxin [Bacteroides sp.]|nr:type II toxin-antitoxin system VapC family toxin [Bacteroides sp.]